MFYQAVNSSMICLKDFIRLFLSVSVVYYSQIAYCFSNVFISTNLIKVLTAFINAHFTHHNIPLHTKIHPILNCIISKSWWIFEIFSLSTKICLHVVMIVLVCEGLHQWSGLCLWILPWIFAQVFIWCVEKQRGSSHSLGPRSWKNLHDSVRQCSAPRATVLPWT